MSEEECCGLCYYYRRGACLRLPPRPLYDFKSDEYGRVVWPVTDEGHWCGEYRRKKDEMQEEEEHLLALIDEKKNKVKRSLAEIAAIINMLFVEHIDNTGCPDCKDYITVEDIAWLIHRGKLILPD